MEVNPFQKSNWAHSFVTRPETDERQASRPHCAAVSLTTQLEDISWVSLTQIKHKTFIYIITNDVNCLLPSLCLNRSKGATFGRLLAKVEIRRRSCLRRLNTCNTSNNQSGILKLHILY